MKPIKIDDKRNADWMARIREIKGTAVSKLRPITKKK